MTKRKLFSLLFICLPLVAPASAISAEKLKLISMKEINSKGYPARLKDGTRVRVVGLRNSKNPEKNCSLDARSLQTLSINNWTLAGKGATATINLQARIGPKGHPYCSGHGDGCVMTVEVPDADEIKDKLSG